MADIEISEDVLDVLRRSTIEDNVLVLPPGQLDRPLYEAINKVLKNAGGQWKRGKGHVFPSDPREKLGLAMETGVSVDEKKLFQAFYTPPELAKRVVELADIQSGNVILEPSCGEGSLIRALLECGADWASITAIDINPEAARETASLAEASDESIHVYMADFLGTHLKLRAGDFDRVVMNPPFTKGQDIKHVEKALSLLAPDGILVAIVGPMTPRNPKFLEVTRNHFMHVEEVPAGTFKESGTNIATAIVVLKSTPFSE